MTTDSDRKQTDVFERLNDIQEIPRRNGELVFSAPWESRAFAMAVALSTSDVYSWDVFQQSLIQEIATWDQNQDREEWDYYERWLIALERVLTSRRVLNTAEIDARQEVITGEDDHQPNF